MGFKPVADLECDTTIALGGRDKKSGKNNPTTITGYYIGSKQVASAKSKTGFAAVHVFQTKNGNTGVWGKTNLDQKMKAAIPGALTRVTFVGMVETKNNPMYKYSVEVDQDDTIEVGTASANEAAADDGYAGYEGDSEAEADEIDPPLEADEAPLDEVPAPRSARPTRPAQAPTSASAAEVQRQLRSRAARN